MNKNTFFILIRKLFSIVIVLLSLCFFQVHAQIVKYKKDTPAIISIFIDNSGSLTTKNLKGLQQILNKAKGFLDKDDLISLWKFSENNRLIASNIELNDYDFVTNFKDYDFATDSNRIQLNGRWTVLYDALITGQKYIKNLSDQLQLPSLFILVTDGFDDNSKSSKKEAIQAIFKHQVPILTIAIKGKLGINFEFLDQITKLSGGELYVTENFQDYKSLLQIAYAIDSHIREFGERELSYLVKERINKGEIELNTVENEKIDTEKYKFTSNSNKGLNIYDENGNPVQLDEKSYRIVNSISEEAKTQGLNKRKLLFTKDGDTIFFENDNYTIKQKDGVFYLLDQENNEIELDATSMLAVEEYYHYKEEKRKNKEREEKEREEKEEREAEKAAQQKQDYLYYIISTLLIGTLIGIIWYRRKKYNSDLSQFHDNVDPTKSKSLLETATDDKIEVKEITEKDYSVLNKEEEIQSIFFNAVPELKSNKAKQSINFFIDKAEEDEFRSSIPDESKINLANNLYVQPSIALMIKNTISRIFDDINDEKEVDIILCEFLFRLIYFGNLSAYEFVKMINGCQLIQFILKSAPLLKKNADLAPYLSVLETILLAKGYESREKIASAKWSRWLNTKIKFERTLKIEPELKHNFLLQIKHGMLSDVLMFYIRTNDGRPIEEKTFHVFLNKVHFLSDNEYHFNKKYQLSFNNNKFTNDLEFEMQEKQLFNSKMKYFYVFQTYDDISKIEPH